MNYFTLAYAVKEHDNIIELSGGLFGIKDIGNIESPLEHIKNDDYYPTLEAKITHLVFSIIKNHAFNDGNKRSAIAISSFLLEINGMGFLITKFIRSMENIVVEVADNRIDKELLEEIITSIIYETEYSEQLKLKLINALSN